MTALMTPQADVSAAINGFPPAVRDCHLRIRDMILSLAEDLGAGPLEETLKWGQPAYLNTTRKTGTTLRLGVTSETPARAGVYVHCQTTLVRDFRLRQDQDLAFDGNRGLLLDPEQPLPEGPLRAFISQALTYHRDKKANG